MQMKKGGCRREKWSLLDFRNMVHTCKVSDLPFIGNNMTWLGKRRTHIVESWIDREMANDEWRANYPASQVESLELIESDHRPVVIKIRRTTDQGLKPFYFDARLCQKVEIKDIVTNVWKQDCLGSFDTVQDKIKESRKEISAWSRSNPINAAKRIKELKASIDRAHTDPAIDLDQIRDMRKELAKEYRNEIYWHQKSRNKWLNHGDRNTRFFHAVTKNRIARNKLTSIQTTNGETIYGNQKIVEEAEMYFKDLFSSSNNNDMEKVLSNINPVVTNSMNEALTKKISAEEVRTAVFSIGATRAPGPDGFTTCFYQNYWEEVGPAITKELQLFFETGNFPQNWNHTNLCLIPKIDQPGTMKDLPVSLCNVI